MLPINPLEVLRQWKNASWSLIFWAILIVLPWIFFKKMFSRRTQELSMKDAKRDQITHKDKVQKAEEKWNDVGQEIDLDSDS